MTSLADQEFLASFGVEIDETGLARLQEALTENRALAEEVAAAFSEAKAAVEAFFNEISSSSFSAEGEASVTEGSSGLSVSLSLDTTAATKALNAFKSEATKPLKLTADASAVISAGQAALSALKSQYSSSKLTLNVQVNKTTNDTSGDTSGTSGNVGTWLSSILTKAATGGRFTSPTKAEIAEDGDPEYVIPVKKESIAVPLLSQLFSELSDSAKETLGLSSGKKERGDALSGLPDLLSSASSAAAPVVNQNTTASVQAPVSIQVTAAGSDPQEVGQSVYNVAERYLLRTLQSAASSPN